MTESAHSEHILRARMHGLYLSRTCADIVTLAHELMGLHAWFARNVCFSSLIRGADISAWKTALTKTWLYRGTLHGVPYGDLPRLLSLHAGDTYLNRYFSDALVEEIANEVLRHMEDGVYSRVEFRRIFAPLYDARTVDAMFSPWGGVFVHLARQGRVAFRDMTSRDFDLISAEPPGTPEDLLPDLLRRYFTAYGPATMRDAAWFFGLEKDRVGVAEALLPADLERTEHKRAIYYHAAQGDMGEIPELTLLSGFDPLVVSYHERSAVLPPEYKSRVILKSGICLPSIAVNGRIAGLWNIKKGEVFVEFFTAQPKRIRDAASDMAEGIAWEMKRNRL